MGLAESIGTVRLESGQVPSFRCICDGREITSGDVSAAWYHQPPIVGDDPSHGRAGRVAVATSLQNYWLGALDTFPCEWLNAPAPVHAAGQKLLQLTAAKSVGLEIPATTCGTDANEVRAQRPSPTVAKNLADLHLAWGDDSNLAFLTRQVDLSALTDALTTVPVIYQEQLTGFREYRVVVVAGQPFAAAIDWADRARAVDVRTSAAGLRGYRRAALPAPVVAQLQALLERLRLGYCSADLAEGSDGLFRLLDLNACGAWWWVDDLYEGAVTTAIADELRRLSRAGSQRTKPPSTVTTDDG